MQTQLQIFCIFTMTGDVWYYGLLPVFFNFNVCFDCNLDYMKFFCPAHVFSLCTYAEPHKQHKVCCCSTYTHCNKSILLTATNNKGHTCCGLRGLWNVHCLSEYELLWHDEQDAGHLGRVELPFWYVHIPATDTGIHSLKHWIRKHLIYTLLRM